MKSFPKFSPPIGLKMGIPYSPLVRRRSELSLIPSLTSYVTFFSKFYCFNFENTSKFLLCFPTSMHPQPWSKAMLSQSLIIPVTSSLVSCPQPSPLLSVVSISQGNLINVSLLCYEFSKGGVEMSISSWPKRLLPSESFSTLNRSSPALGLTVSLAFP